MANDFEAEIIEFYNQHVEGIYCFCLFRLFTRDIAEEATSEVFLKLVEKYPSLRKDGQKKKTEISVRRWLYGTARNAISYQIRSAKRQQETVKGITYAKSNNIKGFPKSARYIEFEDICKAISKLSAQDQEIIIHRFWKGLHTSGIAEWMGLEHSTVRVRLSRAIQKLRKILGASHA